MALCRPARWIVLAAAMALGSTATAQTDDEGKNQATAAAQAQPAAPPASAPAVPTELPAGDPKFEPIAEEAKPPEAAEVPPGPLVPERVTGPIAEPSPAGGAGKDEPAAPLVPTREVGEIAADPVVPSGATASPQRGLQPQDPKAPKPDLPELPAAPAMVDTPYPECRDDYQAIEDAFRKADKTTECVDALDAWHAAVLVPHRQAMLDHQAAIAELYETRVQNNFNYSQIQRDEFFETVTAEHEASNLDGDHLAPYREALARYEADRAYLRERFCRYAATCADWTATAETAQRDAADARVAPTVAPGEQSASRSSGGSGSRGNNDCGTERAGGGLLGGIFGGVVGEATGLGALAGVLIGQAAGVLVADIACRLEPEEQEKAVEATEQVIERGEVGATAEWTSPTRADVSGSSTVTALNSQPSGAACIDITDIVIIGGEETRVDKTMCRQPGESRYTLQA